MAERRHRPTPDRPARMPLHGLYFLLYAIGLVCGLWQHGDPRLTLGLLAAVLPLALIGYVPYRLINEDVRLFSQYLLGASSLGWAMHRLSTRPPTDLLLVETFAILGLSFAFTSTRRGYYYMLMISVVLMFYGSLVPPRQVYVLLMPVGFLLCLMVLYQTRAAALANDAELSTRGSLDLRSLPGLLLHGGATMALWALLILVFPAPGQSTAGLAPSSFRVRNLSLLPPSVDAWLQSPHTAPAPAGQRQGESQLPRSVSPRGKIRVPADAETPAMDSDGSGGGPPGNDLVMRVQSPLKLYWLGALYDVYDGRDWLQSDTLKATTWQQPGAGNDYYHGVQQTFIIEKWVTRTLFAAFLRQDSAVSPVVMRTEGVRARGNYAQMQVRRPREELPYPCVYDIYSVLNYRLPSELTPAGEPGGWYESRPASDYLQLPDAAISQRTRDLVHRLTAGLDDPLAKAYALRDYLRDTYPYTLETPPMPEGREAVDYFLFELRRGHCEYYAASLAVMARLAGLPARVATGFSPGNYNVLSGLFEVYEYHAHAWTQIYIPDQGWLTMDGTPPGALPNRSRTTPLIIGQLRDPFSDEWRIRTPELSKETTAFLRQQTDQRSGKRRQNRGSSSLVGDDLPPDSLLVELMKSTIGLEDKGLGDLAKGIGANLEVLVARLGAKLGAYGRQALSLLLSWPTLLLLGLAVAAWLGLPPWQRRRRFQRRLRQCAAWLEQARQLADQAPGDSIVNAFNASRVLLELDGRDKPPQQDLDDYANRLDPETRPAAVAVFDAYIKLRYMPLPPSAEDARLASERAAELSAILLARLQKRDPRGTSMAPAT